MYIVYMRLNTPHRRNLITRLNYVSLHVQLGKVNANTDRIYVYIWRERTELPREGDRERDKHTVSPIDVLKVNEILVPTVSFWFASTITLLVCVSFD